MNKLRDEICANCGKDLVMHHYRNLRCPGARSVYRNTEGLCRDSKCHDCGAQCDRKEGHTGQHHCINCGCRWWATEDEDE